VTDDPDELRYEQAVKYKDPAYATRLLEEIDVHLRYSMPTIKFLGWAIVVLLVLILWRLWR
jgi:hypothetical protein